MTPDVVVADRLVKRYGVVTALAGVSLEIRRGEFIALLGPSGCGKTTLLRAVAGFVQPTSGEIFINGRSVKGFDDIAELDRRGQLDPLLKEPPSGHSVPMPCGGEVRSSAGA